MEGPRKGGRGETETMEFGKAKTGTGELPPPAPNPTPSPQLPMAATADVVESLEAATADVVESLEAAAAAGGGGGGVTPPTTNVLRRQTSIGSANAASKINTNCLCSPTTHAGSFRCRLHRAPPSSSLQRTKSIDPSDSVAATAPPDS